MEAEVLGVLEVEPEVEGGGEPERVFVRLCVGDATTLLVNELLGVPLGELLGVGTSVHAKGGRTASTGSGSPTMAQPSDPTASWYDSGSEERPSTSPTTAVRV